MRACAQCGLSIGDAATFCPVCGARAGALVGTVSVAPGPVVSNSGVSGNGHAADDDGAASDRVDALSGRVQRAALPMREARDLEKTDPGRAAALYREEILRLLEMTADPLDHEGVRHDLLRIFDRLSLVLKREGLPAEALEEVDSAASLGLLDCRDQGIKGHREALRKRRESLHRALT